MLTARPAPALRPAAQRPDAVPTRDHATGNATGQPTPRTFESRFRAHTYEPDALEQAPLRAAEFERQTWSVHRVGVEAEDRREMRRGAAGGVQP